MSGASLIAISNKFVKALGSDNWNRFLEVAVVCYAVLRRNYVQLLDYAQIVFAFMKRSEDNEAYLKQSLMIDVEDDEALKKMKALFTKAPSRMSTKMKNIVHSLAVKGKTKSFSD